MLYPCRLMGAAVAVLFCASAGLAQSVVDPSLQVESWVSGLGSATGVAFLPGTTNDALVLQKDTGKVLLVRDRGVRRTVLDLSVSNDSERGLLGIALHPRFKTNSYVYLYYTAAKRDGGDATANRIVRYRWTGKRLVPDKTIRNLPGGPGPNHNGGRLTFGPDGKLYAVIGDVNRRERTQNVKTSRDISRSGVVLRLNADGTSPKDNPFYNSANAKKGRAALNDIYAYGLRNSFGMAFDPIGKQLWLTDNGVNDYDEINLVRPGFNGGWTRIMGPRSRNPGDLSLVNLGAKARYTDPQFSWASVVAPTDVAFLTNKALGDQYLNDMFVGDFESGTLYDFDLTSNRQSLVLSGPLADRVADNTGSNPAAEQNSIILGSGFGIITSIVPRPDGLYVLSLDSGTLYRIAANSAAAPLPNLPEPASLLIFGVAGFVLLGRRRR